MKMASDSMKIVKLSDRRSLYGKQASRVLR